MSQFTEQLRVFRAATSFLGSRQEARRWMEEPAPALNYIKPVEMVRAGDGEHVYRLIMRLQHGGFAERQQSVDGGALR